MAKNEAVCAFGAAAQPGSNIASASAAKQRYFIEKFLSLIRVVGRGWRIFPHLQRARAEAGLGLNETHHHAHVAV